MNVFNTKLLLIFIFLIYVGLYVKAIIAKEVKLIDDYPILSGAREALNDPDKDKNTADIGGNNAPKNVPFKMNDFYGKYKLIKVIPTNFENEFYPEVVKRFYQKLKLNLNELHLDVAETAEISRFQNKVNTVLKQKTLILSKEYVQLPRPFYLGNKWKSPVYEFAEFYTKDSDQLWQVEFKVQKYKPVLRVGTSIYAPQSHIPVDFIGYPHKYNYMIAISRTFYVEIIADDVLLFTESNYRLEDNAYYLFKRIEKY